MNSCIWIDRHKKNDPLTDDTDMHLQRPWCQYSAKESFSLLGVLCFFAASHAKTTEKSCSSPNLLISVRFLGCI